MLLKFILQSLINNTQKCRFGQYMILSVQLRKMKEAVNKALYDYYGGIMPKLKPEYWGDRQDLANAA
ncbi:TPA: hypothetical protein NEG48_003807 [Elizabethkingia anophelis]|nr:hypothetical protein [Elizabethkingia anophelis]